MNKKTFNGRFTLKFYLRVRGEPLEPILEKYKISVISKDEATEFDYVEVARSTDLVFFTKDYADKLTAWYSDGTDGIRKNTLVIDINAQGKPKDFDPEQDTDNASGVEVDIPQFTTEDYVADKQRNGFGRTLDILLRAIFKKKK